MTRSSRLHALLLQDTAELIPLVGRPADLEPSRRVAVEAAAAQVLAGRRRLRATPAAAGGTPRSRRPPPPTSLALRDLRLTRALVVVAERDAGLPREALDRVDEVEVLQLPHERDRVTRRLAAEAAVQAHLGVHVERRRLLLVERAQAPVAAPDLLQRELLADERDDVGRLPDPHHVLVEDPHSAPEATPRTAAWGAPRSGRPQSARRSRSGSVLDPAGRSSGRQPRSSTPRPSAKRSVIPDDVLDGDRRGGVGSGLGHRAAVPGVGQTVRRVGEVVDQAAAAAGSPSRPACATPGGGRSARS